MEHTAPSEEGLRDQSWFSLGQRQIQKDLTATLSIWEGAGRGLGGRFSKKSVELYSGA